MKKQIMKRAWLIRKEAALKFGCKISEICFSSCLKLAWRESKKMKLKNNKNQEQIEWLETSLIRLKDRLNRGVAVKSTTARIEKYENMLKKYKS